MLEKYLRTIYDKYYNLDKYTDFICDRDIIEFVYFLSKYQIENKTFKDLVSEYKNHKKINIDNI